MTVIRPSFDLRNRYGEIFEFCNQHQEPVFITKNGTGDIVAMSNAEYERLSGKCELYRMLDAGLADAESGKSRKATDVFSDIERKYGLGKV
jgi:prevent-host-death family protein